jgi:signal transduction histidine kinase
MRALLQGVELWGFPGGVAIPHVSENHLSRDVITPAVRQVGALLRQQRFSPAGIRVGGLEGVPGLWIDKPQFKHVFFQILANSVEFALNEPAKFRVEIDGCRLATGFAIQCRDWGVGIPGGFEEAIFEKGVRAPWASNHYVGGQGFGLWVSRLIVGAHGGTLTVTNSANPTEFTIFLPAFLAQHPKGNRR